MSQYQLVPQNKYANEPMLVTTSDWRKAFGGWLDARRGRRQELADHLGCNPSLITHIRKGDVRKSELIMPICHYTELDPPRGHVDPQFLDDLGILRDENPEAYEQLKNLAETFLRPKPAAK